MKTLQYGIESIEIITNFFLLIPRNTTVPYRSSYLFVHNKKEGLAHFLTNNRNVSQSSIKNVVLLYLFCTREVTGYALYNLLLCQLILFLD